jgi:hypothetical protein
LDTVRPAPVSADVASCGESPFTSGTLTLGCALATTIVTVEPETSLAPPDGSWLITLPGVAVSDVVLVVFTLKPAFWRALVAESCDCPTTFGTATFGLPEDTNNVNAWVTDRAGATLGLGFLTGSFDTTLGAVYQYGWGDYLTSSTNLDEAVTVDIHEHFLMMIVSGAVTLEDLL